jgi:hypothetical protein
LSADHNTPLQSLPPRSRWKLVGEASAIVVAAFTFLGVLVSTAQLVELNRGAKIDRANSAVEHFLFAEDVLARAKRISDATEHGTSFVGVAQKNEVKEDINNYLNALEMIAANVNAGFYDERVVRSNLAEIIYKQVNAHLMGRSGALPSGHHWKADEPIFSAEGYFPDLRRLYKKWFPQGNYEPPY